MNSEIYKFCSCSQKDDTTLATFSPNDNKSSMTLDEKKTKTSLIGNDKHSTYIDPDQETSNEPLPIDEKINYPDGSLYVGQTVGGLRNGKGIYRDKTGVLIYEGNWKNDLPSGEGKMLVNSQMIYKGEFEEGIKSGKGKITSIDDTIVFYDGLFLKGEKHQFGEELFPDGSHYIGEYFKGKRQGKGKYYFENGTFYDGDFYDDKIQGKVKFY